MRAAPNSTKLLSPQVTVWKNTRSSLSHSALSLLLLRGFSCPVLAYETIEALADCSCVVRERERERPRSSN